MKALCLDSSGWIEIFHNGSNGKEFLKALKDPAAVIVSAVSLYEVWKYTALNAGEERAVRVVEAMQAGVVIPVSPEIAIQAAEFSLKHKVPMADSLIYITARLQNATLWTQDNHFDGLPHVRYFPKTKS